MSEQTVIHRLEQLAEHIAEGQKVLVLTSPGRRYVDRIEAALPGRELVVFAEARVHVPRATVDAAAKVVAEHKPDVLLTLGGGAATGLGKALRLEATDAPLFAVPTTYAGSEMTRIWGVTDTEGGVSKKSTGRDVKVRPAVVVHDPSLVASLPHRMAVESLFNALAHPVSALSVGIADEAIKVKALRALTRVSYAARQMLQHHGQAEAQKDALTAAGLAGALLDEGAMGVHHKVAHGLGGTHDLPHATLHALLLPHTLDAIRRHAPELYAEMGRAAGTPDLAGFVHDALVRVGAPAGLRKLDVTLDDAMGVAESTGADRVTLLGAWLGSRPSLSATTEVWEDDIPVVVDGNPDSATSVVLALHGRGSNAARIVAQVREAIGHRSDVAVVAPQAATDAWYDLSYAAPPDALKGPLDAAIARVAVVTEQMKTRWPQARHLLYGFSQGACLALEVAARELLAFEQVFAIGGARPSGATDWPGALKDTAFYVSRAVGDRWVKIEDADGTVASLRAVGADVTYLKWPGDKHGVTDRDRLEVRERVGGLPEAPHGFGDHHKGEVLPGAVPMEQNIPRHSPYGLYPEQINGTGFVAKRHENLRTWMYRVRPSAQHDPYVEVAHPTLTAELEDGPLINLDAWTMPDVSTDEGEGHDFVDGLITLGGAGHPELRRGYAVHLYTATRDMTDRAFASADGDMLLLPEQGALTLLTEMGTLKVAPGQVAVVPRGLRFTVLLDEQGAVHRGYVGEIYAKHFHLPERGLIGSNGLADERHFEAPTPWYEDRIAPGYRLASKMGGKLYEAVQDFSPYDVVGWHGNYVPYAYNTSLFSPVSNTRIDHGDPSLYSVLSGGLDEQGAHALDLVVFPARWDPTEHTFKPPFFHRNVTTEINGIVRDPGLSQPFETGMVFITPSMTAHGVRARSVQSYLTKNDTDADKPSRTSDRAMWFQFETAMHFMPTRWAVQASQRRDDWHYVWGEHAPRFDPTAGPAGEE
jgi:homogentisate 1,2-dioxygenase